MKWNGSTAAAFLCTLLIGACTTPAYAHFEPVTCKNSFTPAQEIAEGQKVALTVYKQQPVLPENDPVTKYVQQLGAKLVQFSPTVPGVTQQWPFNFHVVASEDINAFALPGGAVFVNLGTVQAAETEAQLAGVMAHEISHVVMRHSTCNLTKQRNRSLFYGLGAIGSAVLLGNGTAGQLAQTGLGYGQSLDFLHMSRGDEQQADLLGTDILYNAGYDPRGLPQFFEILRGKYGAGGAQFLSDHPNPGNRTEYVDAEIATLPRQPSPLVTSAAFKQVHAVAMQRKPLTAKEVQAGAWKGSGQYATAPGSNGGRIESAAGASSGTDATTGAGSTSSIAALSRSQLGLTNTLVPVQTQRFNLRAPSSWQQSTDASGALTLAPRGGSGSFGLAYGVLVATLAGTNGASGASLDAETKSLIASLSQGNAGLTQTGTSVAMQVGGQQARATDLHGSSPVSNGSGPLPEHDWLVTVGRPDGELSYLVFVAPDQDFAAMKPLFKQILATFQSN